MKKQFPGLNGYLLIAGCMTKSWTPFLVLCMLVVPGISTADYTRCLAGRDCYAQGTADEKAGIYAVNPRSDPKTRAIPGLNLYNKAEANAADTPPKDIEHSGGSTPKAVDLTPKVKELYNQLKQAYESKSTSGVARCLSSQWGSDDGGNVSDLQRNLQKIFTMFDEVRFNIQNMQIIKVNETTYKVSYDVTITSKIYKKNLKHEEKSSISEEVTIDQSGRPKISRTLGGKLLSVK